MEQTTAHSDLHERGSQAAQRVCRLELAFDYFQARAAEQLLFT